ncbi:MAG: MDR family MFS transporter [Myxococcales bacterium]
MSQPTRTQVVLAVAGVLLGTVLQAVDGAIVNIAVPQIQLQLGAPLSLVGWAVTGYVLASLVAMPLAASLAGRIGMRAYFAGSVALFTAASIACALSRSVAALIAFRVLQGFGAGGLLPMSQGVLMSIFPGARRATAVALVGTAAVLGPLFGPPLGGLLTDAFGWRSIFWINVPLGLASVGLVLGFLHLAAPAGKRPSADLDLRGAALLAVSVTSLQLACAHHPAFLPLALGAGLLFARRELRVTAPAVDLSVLRHRQLAGTLVAAPLYGIGLYASVFLLPLLLEQRLGMPAAHAGAVMAVGGVSSGGFMLAARPLLHRFRARSLCAAGAGVFAVSMLLMARVSWLGEGELVFAQALRGAGTGLLYVGMQGFAFESIPDPDVPTSASLFFLLRQLGGSVGVALSAVALDQRGNDGMTAAFFLLALTAPISLLPMHLWQRRPGSREAERGAQGAGPAPEAM